MTDSGFLPHRSLLGQISLLSVMSSTILVPLAACEVGRYRLEGRADGGIGRPHHLEPVDELPSWPRGRAVRTAPPDACRQGSLWSPRTRSAMGAPGGSWLVTRSASTCLAMVMRLSPPNRSSMLPDVSRMRSTATFLLTGRACRRAADDGRRHRQGARRGRRQLHLGGGQVQGVRGRAAQPGGHARERLVHLPVRHDVLVEAAACGGPVLHEVPGLLWRGITADMDREHDGSHAASDAHSSWIR